MAPGRHVSVAGVVPDLLTLDVEEHWIASQVTRTT